MYHLSLMSVQPLPDLQIPVCVWLQYFDHVKGIVLPVASLPPLQVLFPKPRHPGPALPCPYGSRQPSEGCEGAPPAFTTHSNGGV